MEWTRTREEEGLGEWTPAGRHGPGAGAAAGHPPDFAQGGGPAVDALADALESAPAVLRSVQSA